MSETRFGWRLAVHLVGALALVLVAFAHRGPLLSPSALQDAAAYAFPDGSIPVICVTLPAEPGKPGVRHALPCDACLIAAGVLVPQPPAFSFPAFADASPRLQQPARFVLPRSTWPPAAPPTAPPFA